MASTPLERAFRHDRIVVLSAIAALSALAWAYVVWVASETEMSSGGMDMPGMMDPGFEPWRAADFFLMWLMWAVMMVGMMLPSVAPMVLIYAGVARHAHRQGKPFAATGWFAAGYLLSWAAFAVLATATQWGLERTAILLPMTLAVDNTLGGVVLIVAGLYQWTPFKDRCLSQCQSPLVFIQRHGGFRSGFGSSLRLGAQHGFYCIGCCWALMGLLFVTGIMNILWIAVIAVFVLLEKVSPAGRLISRVAGAAAVVAGIWMLS